MLEKIVIGWQEIEKIFLVNVALCKPFILMGRHGTCKTTVAKELSKIYGEDGFRFYDATKDDLVRIAGIPMPDKLAEGKLEFSRHDRSIWEARVIVVDELTRANKENQNLWLEILEEKTCFGKALNYETFIATMNPESYASTFKLDEALLDRFYAVVPVPELQKETSSETYKQLINVNLDKRNNGFNPAEMKEKVERIKENYQRIKENKKICEGIVEYVANFFEVLLSQAECYISPRKTVQLTEEIMALSALEEDPDKSAETALVYTLSIPLKIKPEMLLQIHQNLKPLLRKYSLSETDRVRLEITKLQKPEELIDYLGNNVERVQEFLPFDEFEKLLAKIDVKEESLLIFHQILQRVKGHEEQKRKTEGKLVLLTAEKIGKIIGILTEREVYSQKDMEAKEKAGNFMGLLRKLPLSEPIVNFIFSKEFQDEGKVIEFIKKGGADEIKPETC